MADAGRRPPRIAVSGAGRCGPELAALAEDVGRRLARAGAVLICGGLGGVMEATARGADSADGITIGILPGLDPEGANRFIRIPVPTGLGEGRNVLVAAAAEAVIAIGGEWGTLSEVALAAKMNVPVVLLRPDLTRHFGLPTVDTPEAAVRWALDAARARGATGARP